MTEGRERTPLFVSIHAEERQRELIDQAAEYAGRSREEFVLDAACREAQDLLLDQVFFPLTSPAFAAFQALLDDPPAPNDRLRRLLLTKAPWE